jgi:hypothetical protein
MLVSTQKAKLHWDAGFMLCYIGKLFAVQQCGRRARDVGDGNQWPVTERHPSERR